MASAGLPNPIALPEIAVSRINAFHVAVRLPADRSLATGTRSRLLDGAVTDAAGRPTAFTSTVDYATEPSTDPAVWVIRPDEFEPDPLLERRLLAEYLDRNHRFRSRAWSTHPGWVVAVAHPAGDGFSAAAAPDVLERALPVPPAPSSRTRHRPGTPGSGPNPGCDGCSSRTARPVVGVPADDVDHRPGRGPGGPLEGVQRRRTPVHRRARPLRRDAGSRVAKLFAADAQAAPEGADVGERSARCKKSYPWNLLGDCTLPLHP